ncbi:MAG: hypothetical protein EPO10_00110 [Reyranella sp.]|uniref:hypothetical protein n=1 Tax=Reyranella sp. TaxID=1929291 RepID=UPI0011F92D46|nr:hypothetical protein [Reyranella sp.]TAJ86380.1 MAG: hypothetical protein EPO41_25105 [Reyranella sp.]TBR30967.1 MAG: hypothetical protein EPO10_00110 [Reyranella sp.]
MSDYDPNLGPGRFGYDPKDPYRAPHDGRPGYILLAALAGVALVGGFLYFGNPQNSAGPEQAQAPAPIERTVTDRPAATPDADRPAAVPLPANPASPAPATSPAAPQE